MHRYMAQTSLGYTTIDLAGCELHSATKFQSIMSRQPFSFEAQIYGLTQFLFSIFSVIYLDLILTSPVAMFVTSMLTPKALFL